ncbi:hypothetical protein, partial [Mycobacterium asiaticum]|uniref:hypothetical protein n=1 Tax=Mycobacterium asiaticum TaxID=1790 RepID=UPI001B80B55D
MTDFPPGEWSFLLIGDNWPTEQELLVLEQGKTRRHASKTGFYHFADELASVRTSELAEQRGLTVEDLREAFQRGATQARGAAEKNGIKETAYGTAIDSVKSLRQALTEIAQEGNREINRIQASPTPGPAKIAQVVELVQKCRTEANAVAAKYGANILDAIQRILDADGAEVSARSFAQAAGADATQLFRQRDSQQDLETRVGELLSGSHGSTGIPSNASTHEQLDSQSPGTSMQSDGPLPCNLATTPHPVTAAGRSSRFTSAAGLPNNSKTQPMTSPVTGNVPAPISLTSSPHSPAAPTISAPSLTSPAVAPL